MGVEIAADVFGKEGNEMVVEFAFADFLRGLRPDLRVQVLRRLLVPIFVFTATLHTRGFSAVSLVEGLALIHAE